MLLSAVLMCLALTSAMESSNGGDQHVFTHTDREWRVDVSRKWNVLGPFPIHAREQHFLSPSFPLNLTEPLNLNARFPSSYADGGDVGWSTAHSGETGTLDVSFPDIRWTSLRATEGWAALQHHTVLHTTITLYPPSSLASLSAPPHLLVDVLQGSFFTVLPSNRPSSVPVVPVWHAGNVYAIGGAPPQAVTIPTPVSTTSPTSYDLFVSGDYEIRLFGDPGYDEKGSRTPTLSVTVSVDIETEPPVGQMARESSHDISCDFVDGWAFGNALGVGVRSAAGWWTVKRVILADAIHGIEVSLVKEIGIAPTQTRVLPIRIIQSGAFHGTEIHLSVLLVSEASTTSIPVVLPISQHPLWTASSFPPAGIKASYFFATSMPTAFLVIPPEEKNEGNPFPPLLALHGAGVDIFSGPFWIEALPRQKHSWVIAPTGRTAWGLDWHGPSTQDAWGTVDALHSILKGGKSWHPWALSDNTRVLILGHSNGGQGTWYMASRYPDRVVAAIPAAAYIKSQSYVPLTQARYAHFIDPFVRAILESSLTPDDNDLFLSNLVDMPILAIHGGDDENVPVWHTREAVSVLKTWNPQANVSYREDRGKPHWYPSVFANGDVQKFIDSVVEDGKTVHAFHPGHSSFTLTVSIPAESASLHGWQILRLGTPGRLARLTVEVRDRAFIAVTTNVKVFSIRKPVQDQAVVVTVDSVIIPFDLSQYDNSDFIYFSLDGGTWTPLSFIPDVSSPPHGRMSRILSTAAPFTIIIPDNCSPHTLSSALRVAHNLNVYHKLDAEIIVDAEAVRRIQSHSVGEGNIVVIGGADGEFSRVTLEQKKTAFNLANGSLHLRERSVSESSAVLFLHPHPVISTGLMLFLYACDIAGLDQAVRLFPIRTGIALPDFLVVRAKANIVGASAVDAAGVWGDGWNWNNAMSSF